MNADLMNMEGGGDNCPLESMFGDEDVTNCVISAAISLNGKISSSPNIDSKGQLSPPPSMFIKSAFILIKRKNKSNN